MREYGGFHGGKKLLWIGRSWREMLVLVVAAALVALVVTPEVGNKLAAGRVVAGCGIGQEK